MLFTTLCSLLLISLVSGCPTFDFPKYGNISCTSDLDVYTCQFSCESWTDLIGPNITTCSFENGKWDHNFAPICEPNFSRCGKRGQPKCPKQKITKTQVDEKQKYRKYLTESDLAALEQIEMEFDAELMLKGPKTFKCTSAMCRFPCSVMRRKRFASKCRRCKKTTLKCSKNGSLFG